MRHIQAHRITMAESDPRGGDRAPINVFVEWRKAELAELADGSDLPPARAGSHHDHARHVTRRRGGIRVGIWVGTVITIFSICLMNRFFIPS